MKGIIVYYWTQNESIDNVNVIIVGNNTAIIYWTVMRFHWHRKYMNNDG